MDAYLALERRFSAGMASWDSSWVDAGTLHKELKVGKAFTNWIKGRINRYEFVGNEDYKPDSPKRVNQNSHGEIENLRSALSLLIWQKNYQWQRIIKLSEKCNKEM